jgi:hypothetical protein
MRDVDMLIADRGFGDLLSLAERKFFGKFAKTYFKYGSMGWQADNSHNFVHGR